MKKLDRCATTDDIAEWAKRAAGSIATLQPDDRDELETEWHSREAELHEREALAEE